MLASVATLVLLIVTIERINKMDAAIKALQVQVAKQAVQLRSLCGDPPNAQP